MWKIAQPAPRKEPKNVPARPVAAHNPISKKIISPAYMFPYKRNESDSGLDKYSTKLNSKLAGQSRGFEPKGVQKSSRIQPPRPFTLMLKKIIRDSTERDRANVVLTSAVATWRQ